MYVDNYHVCRPLDIDSINLLRGAHLFRGAFRVPFTACLHTMNVDCTVPHCMIRGTCCNVRFVCPCPCLACMQEWLTSPALPSTVMQCPATHVRVPHPIRVVGVVRNGPISGNPGLLRPGVRGAVVAPPGTSGLSRSGVRGGVDAVVHGDGCGVI